MTQDEIIEMARKAGLQQDGDMWFSNLYKTDIDVHISHLEAFAKLVAAKEREACAKVADDAMGRLTDDAWCAARIIKQEIKARGET